MSQVLRIQTFSGGQRLEVAAGDITGEQLDAIVNAANTRLAHGGGVAGAISRKGGPTIQQESNRWIAKHGPVSHARPAYTSAGNLPCKYVIHAVGPIWGQGDEDQRLAEAVRGSLQLASELNLTSLAMPAISTGIFGFPLDRAAGIIFTTITEYLHRQTDSSLRLVRLVLFDQATLDAFLATFDAQQASGISS